MYPQSMFFSKNIKTIKKICNEIFIFYSRKKNLSILHGRVFVMEKCYYIFKKFRLSLSICLQKCVTIAMLSVLVLHLCACFSTSSLTSCRYFVF